MRGTIRYYEADPEFINSIEGWVVKSPENRFENYIVCEDSDREVRDRHKRGLLSDGDEVEYELIFDCKFDADRNVIIHSTKSKIIFEKEKKQKLFLIDIDGTICDDIKNEDSHLYPTANVYPKALEIINKWYDEGNVITFFTARESKDRVTTEAWLNDHGFKYHGLVMDKPRINDDQEYVWIDNKKVRAITYLGTWSDLKEVDARIQIFG
jgi:hypothetical protein